MEIMDFHHKKYQEHQQEIKNHPKSPSPTTSPSHEFSFTISLQPSQASTSTTSTTSTTSSSTSSTAASKDKSPASKSSPPSFAVDLSPADDIFFHGHLLPLHLLSHLPISPRSSTNSLDSFTIPIKDGHHHHHHQNGQDRHMINASSCNKICSEKIHRDEFEEITQGSRQPTKSKSFSLFGLSSKWKKENGDTTPRSSEEQQKRKLKFDNVSHVLKRYMRRVFGNGKRENHVNFHRQGFSYSGNLSLRRKPELIGRRGEFSAPVSMRTSPTNSGLLGPSSGTRSPTYPTSDSTMEELQSAIQAAIAHCKNSISMENKIMVP